MTATTSARRTRRPAHRQAFCAGRDCRGKRTPATWIATRALTHGNGPKDSRWDPLCKPCATQRMTEVPDDATSWFIRTIPVTSDLLADDLPARLELRLIKAELNGLAASGMERADAALHPNEVAAYQDMSTDVQTVADGRLLPDDIGARFPRLVPVRDFVPGTGCAADLGADLAADAEPAVAR